MVDRSPCLEVMIRAARAAADGLMRDFRHLDRLRIEEKAPSDFVSTADLRAQEVLRRELSVAYPDHALLMEEGTGQSEAVGARRFIVDPLDGTTNFLRGMPHFAISIALEVAGEVTMGLVLDPAKDEVFWAEKGKGAWLGDSPIRVALERALPTSVIGTGIPHHGRGDHGSYLAALANVMREVAGIRRFGSAALDLSYVAASRFDAFFELGLAPWDVAAGALLVREAGGVVTTTAGGTMTVDGKDVLATCCSSLHERLIAMLEPLHRPTAVIEA
jgi:myo-inositol-1(or 4)-monophosphatase